MSTPIIEITDLTKTYGKSRGIDRVNFQVNEGEIFGFIGPNGAGKSTTIRILLNLIFPTSGSARILNMDVIADTKKIKQHIGYIPSDANAYPSMGVKEFLVYCMRFYNVSNGEQRIRELCERFELDLTRNIADLSLGNRKKVSIIQSLIHKPKLLILDEPTTGLDPLMQSRFFELLRTENQDGMTILFSSHILNEVQQFCKRVAIIKDGKIIQLENIENLRKKQLKKIEVEFSDLTEYFPCNAQGVENLLKLHNNAYAFLFSGQINDLVKSLSGFNINNLTIEEPSLEEIFMHFYN